MGNGATPPGYYLPPNVGAVPMPPNAPYGPVNPGDVTNRLAPGNNYFPLGVGSGPNVANYSPGLGGFIPGNVTYDGRDDVNPLRTAMQSIVANLSRGGSSENGNFQLGNPQSARAYIENMRQRDPRYQAKLARIAGATEEAPTAGASAMIRAGADPSQFIPTRIDYTNIPTYRISQEYGDIGATSGARPMSAFGGPNTPSNLKSVGQREEVVTLPYLMALQRGGANVKVLGQAGGDPAAWLAANKAKLYTPKMTKDSEWNDLRDMYEGKKPYPTKPNTQPKPPTGGGN